MQIKMANFTLQDQRQFYRLLRQPTVKKGLAIDQPLTNQLSDQLFTDYFISGHRGALLLDGDDLIAGVMFDYQMTAEYEIDQQTILISYFIDDRFANQGLMSRYLPLIIKEFVKSYAITKVQAEVFSDNLASIKLLKKANFELIMTNIDGYSGQKRLFFEKQILQ